jgi:hypothetical protein
VQLASFIRSLSRGAALVAVGALVLAAAPNTAAAQVSCVTSPSCSVNHQVTLNIPATLRLTLSTAGTTINASRAEIEAGQTGAAAGPNIQVLSNRLFSLSVATNAAQFAGPVGSTKPATDLLFSFNGGADASLRTAPLALVTGGARGVSNYTSGFKVNLSAVEPDGAYGIIAQFTVSAP